jgi:hypothetical protein
MRCVSSASTTCTRISKGTSRSPGTLVAEWTSDKDNLQVTDPDISVVPDAASIARLPHFAGYAVRHLELRNGTHALFMAAGAERASALFERKFARIEATGTCVVTDFTVGVTCDASWARATVVSATVSDPRLEVAFEPVVTC